MKGIISFVNDESISFPCPGLSYLFTDKESVKGGVSSLCLFELNIPTIIQGMLGCVNSNVEQNKLNVGGYCASKT